MNNNQKEIVAARISANGTILAAIIGAIALVAVALIGNWKTIFPQDNKSQQPVSTEGGAPATQPSIQTDEKSPQKNGHPESNHTINKTIPIAPKKTPVKTNKNNLVWSNTSKEPCTWIEANVSKIGHFSGGRLPTIQEAQALVNNSNLNQIIINKGYYWTSSIEGNTVKVINLHNGNIEKTAKDTLNFFLLVRKESIKTVEE